MTRSKNNILEKKIFEFAKKIMDVRMRRNHLELTWQSKKVSTIPEDSPYKKILQRSNSASKLNDEIDEFDQKQAMKRAVASERKQVFALEESVKELSRLE